ncbi:AAA family ATPase [Roseibium aggregatum]|uniref:Cell division ATP-binding protein FtsE n=1 Tax=Roseibium aggregatum TaxID=187304 RepID=A0A0M6Y579_9HYPH|nr:AAA family ATPase [Roseibium aggregatum]CTQ44519.1 cell division ATP-binding protein FtsE [Roseibium aggregatum]
MHLISRVSIEGFWDSYDFDVAIDPNVTFFIGQNGTGKTTFINLLAAALTADFKTLDRIPFQRITIHLIPQKKGEKPSITVSKSRKKDRPFELIDYRINRGTPNAKEIRFSLDDSEEQMILRRLRHDQRYLEHHYRFQSGLTPVLSELVSVKWLSIHRTSPNDQLREDRAYESTVDRKLESLSNDLVRYFATLSRQKDDEIRAFQEYLFVSLIEHREDIDPFDKKRLGLVPQYTEALQTIFQELHVQRDTSSLLSNFSKRAAQYTKNSEQSADTGLTSEELIFRIGLYRIEDVVTRWEALQDRLKMIFSQKDRFQEIADNLFQRKTLTFSESNELVFRSRSGKPLTPQMLSSGEKQLLILMSEALLQREMPAIFIADEPELSLHVLWQEQLVSSLRTLNPKAQIIAATHSPDIVGPLSKKAIDMESLVQ